MPKRHRIVWLLVVGVLSVLGITGKAFTENSPPPIANSQTIFHSIAPEIVKSGVPLRLPTYIPAIGQRLNDAGTPPAQVYATVETVSDGSYAVTLGYTQDCSGGNACRLGTVAGDRQTAQTQPIEVLYSFMRDPNFQGIRSGEEMAPVALSHDLKGWFIPWICGANCNDAKVVWDEGAYRYLVGIKLGDQDSLVKMANSAIDDRR